MGSALVAGVTGHDLQIDVVAMLEATGLISAEVHEWTQPSGTSAGRHQQQEPTCLGVLKQRNALEQEILLCRLVLQLLTHNLGRSNGHTKNDHTLLCSRQLGVTPPNNGLGFDHLANLVSSSTRGGVAPHGSTPVSSHGVC